MTMMLSIDDLRKGEERIFERSKKVTVTPMYMYHESYRQPPDDADRDIPSG
jgi:hypothetical protein